ncbi:hypothetical protein EPA93_21615 [Ktedonosporobacter rubrisoli]|uniref:DUF4878 domain-containing protein n=1 Tax=Ktedonosporobacter rubrisoli TaxID=2509675 RepID=A0A4V0YZ46_KTERU|nr:hypothetical protein [Ktedonosporobacter rubrisoli]QBD78451.1 hypothetical protein EPA93_21615 [Ktedonosporobacter rubrisoli]
MQGRQDHSGELWEKPANKRTAELNGTGKHRTIPQRPPGMARIEHPPAKPRVARPQSQTSTPKKFRKQLLIITAIFFVCAAAAGIGSYMAYNLFQGISVSSGASTAAAGFLGAVSKSDYAQAYTYLGPAITLPTHQAQFIQQAQALDRCYGPVADYSEVANSATNQDNSQSFSYTLTRSKLKKPYQIRITLQQDRDSPNTWKIADYGNDLGPGASAPACKA